MKILFNKAGELGETVANERLGRIDRPGAASILPQENAWPKYTLFDNKQPGRSSLSRTSRIFSNLPSGQL
jgi:hypothetical protein